MEFARKLIRLEMICLEFDKSKNFTDFEYMNILVDDFSIVPFTFLDSSDFSLDLKLRSMYNEWVKVDFDWTTKYLADIVLSNDIIIIRYIIKIPKINNSILKGKMITTYDFLQKRGDESYDRIISG